MNGNGDIPELHLQKIWQDQRISRQMRTISGDNITVLNSGDHNTNRGGPDFKNARIRIGNLTFVGDIEIDRDYGDWKLHGHNTNNNYNSVILHVSFKNKFKQEYVYTQDGRKIPSVLLCDFVDQKIFKEVSNEIEENKKNNVALKCSSHAREIDNELKKSFLKDQGYVRFRRKTNRILERLNELAYLNTLSAHEPIVQYDLPPEFHNYEFSQEDYKSEDIWNQLFYEFTFEALGYSKNKSIMQKLSKAANISYLKDKILEDNNIEILESIYFNIAGLMPDIENLPDDEVSDYLMRLNTIWENEKSNYDNVVFDETDWHFFQLRPHNFPTIRLAGGSRIIRKLIRDDFLNRLKGLIAKENNFEKLIRKLRSAFIVSGEGYWQKHFVFGKESNTSLNYFIGASRSDEIVINVLLPYFMIYFEIFGPKERVNKVLNTFYLYTQKADNKIITDVALSLNLNDLKNRSIFTQGMIEVFRNYCSKNKCRECGIGKEIY